MCKISVLLSTKLYTIRELLRRYVRSVDSPSPDSPAVLYLPLGVKHFQKSLNTKSPHQNIGSRVRVSFGKSHRVEPQQRKKAFIWLQAHKRKTIFLLHLNLEYFRFTWTWICLHWPEPKYFCSDLNLNFLLWSEAQIFLLSPEPQPTLPPAFPQDRPPPPWAKTIVPNPNYELFQIPIINYSKSQL